VAEEDSDKILKSYFFSIDKSNWEKKLLLFMYVMELWW
jgi:hypothetical protein